MRGAAYPFGAVAERLRARLLPGAPYALPGHDAHLAMAPTHRLDRAGLSVEGKTGREAAVLELLHPDADGEAVVVLTARPDTLRDHAGQVAFPGGRREPGEAFVETALREAREEIGLDARTITLAGALTPIYVPPSRFRVYPFVALAEAVPRLVPGETEVAEILHVRLADLFSAATQGTERRTVGGTPSVVPYFAAGRRRVWGATAMLLAELRAVLAP